MTASLCFKSCEDPTYLKAIIEVYGKQLRVQAQESIPGNATITDHRDQHMVSRERDGRTQTNKKQIHLSRDM